MIKKKIWGISNHGSWFLPCCEWNGMLNFQLKLRLRLLFSIKGKVTNQKIAGVFFKKVCPQPPSPPLLPPLLMDLWISSEIAQFRQGYLCRYGHIASKKGGREGGEPCMKSHVDGKDCHKIKSSVMLFSETTC